MTRFPKNPNSSPKRSSGAISIVQLVVFLLCITLLAAIVIQNLQPAIQIIFFGQKTAPIALSVAMLLAFGIGGLLAFIFNAIATWQQNLAIRRAIVSAGGDRVRAKPESYKNGSDDDQEDGDQEYDEDDLDDWDEDEDNLSEEDPDTVPYGDRPNLKYKNSAKSDQSKRDRPPLEAKYVD